MSTAKITLLGLQTMMHKMNDDLFADIELPEGIDSEILTNNILLRGADFEVLYPNPVFMKDVITLISKKWYRTFDKWVTALAIEYNPLENYDRKEDWSDTLNKGIKTSARRDSGNTRTFDNTDTDTPGTTITDEKQVSAYDSSTYQPSEKNTSTPTGYNTLAHSGTVTDEFGEGSSGSETENSKTVRDGRIHGNIGVTTSQQMLESELQLAEWNLYEHITDIFLSETVIPIYS